MTDSTHKILLVESDPDTMEVVVASLAQRFDAQVTCVADAETCLDTDMLEPHDLVICEMELPDATGIELSEKLQSLRVRPIILLAHDPDLADAVEAMRLGVRDLFVRPFAVRALTDSVDRALRGFHVRRRHAQKYYRMRELVRRMIRERRHLNQRVDLICRDLVGAQRRLVHKFVAAERSQG